MQVIIDYMSCSSVLAAYRIAGAAYNIAKREIWRHTNSYYFCADNPLNQNIKSKPNDEISKHFLIF